MRSRIHKLRAYKFLYVQNLLGGKSFSVCRNIEKKGLALGSHSRIMVAKRYRVECLRLSFLKGV